MREVIQTDQAPEAIGPYSQAIKVPSSKSFIFCSGQIPLVPGDMTMVEPDAAKQCGQVMDNLQAVLEAAGAKLADIVKATIYLTDLKGDFGAVNEIYASYFSDEPPARVCVEVSRLPKDALVEIDAIAVV